MTFSIRFGTLLRLISLACLLSALIGCGRKGPLLPPEALVPAAVKDLSVQQKGERLVLSWTPPSREVGGAPLKEDSGAIVYRRDLSARMDCEACPPAFQTVNKLLPGEPGQRVSGRLFHHDTQVAEAGEYEYYVTSFLSDGAVSPPSNHVRRKVVHPPAPPNVTLAADPVGLELVWNDPSMPEGGELIGYNIYRRKDEEPFPPVPLNSLPLKETRYEDLRLEKNRKYHYALRTVARIEGEVVESVLSNEVTGISPAP